MLLTLLLSVLHTYSQEPPRFKFGRVNADEFKRTVYSVDSGANAVILAEIGTSEFVGNTSGGFTLQFKVYRRAHILKKNGYGVADVVIPLYTGSQSEEKLSNLRASTYNLENGKVVLPNWKSLLFSRTRSINTGYTRNSHFRMYAKVPSLNMSTRWNLPIFLIFSPGIFKVKTRACGVSTPFPFPSFSIMLP